MQRKNIRIQPARPKHQHIQIDPRTQELALESFSNDNFLSINKRLIHVFGLNNAVYLSNIIEKFRYFKKVGRLQKDGSFFIRMHAQQKEIGLSQYQLRKCKKELIAAELLLTKMKGIPPKEFYFLDIKNLTESVLTSIPLKSGGMEVKKVDEYNKNKEYKNKEKRNTKKRFFPFKQFIEQMPPKLKKDNKLLKAIRQFIKYRSEMNKPIITKTTVTRLINKMNGYPSERIILSIHASIEMGWIGIFPDNDRFKKTNIAPEEYDEEQINEEDSQKYDSWLSEENKKSMREQDFM